MSDESDEAPPATAPPAPDAGRERAWLRAVGLGAALGAGYGLVMRILLALGSRHLLGNEAAGIMTLAFLVGVPVGMGWLTLSKLASSRWYSAILLPWIPVLACLVTAALVGWEGSICLIMGAPIMLLGGSIGGLVAHVVRRRAGRGAHAFLLLPLVLALLESRHEPEPQVRVVRTERTIDAPARTVWRNVVQVPEITPAEQRPALFTALGFPRPLSAVLLREETGAVRHARFEGGVLFEETVTDLVPERRLAFTLRARTDLIPPTTLDPHVTIGGPFFDMLDGVYELEALPDGRTHVVLTSRHRLSTRFDMYSGLWSDAIMRSIQRNILSIVQARCERAAETGT